MDLGGRWRGRLWVGRLLFGPAGLFAAKLFLGQALHRRIGWRISSGPSDICQPGPHVILIQGGKGFSGRTLRKTEEQKKAVVARGQAMEVERQRKLDVRRKVTIGGLVLPTAKHSPEWSKIVGDMIRKLDRPTDAKAFIDWKPAS